MKIRAIQKRDSCTVTQTARRGSGDSQEAPLGSRYDIYKTTTLWPYTGETKQHMDCLTAAWMQLGPMLQGAQLPIREAGGGGGNFGGHQLTNITNA